MKDEIELDLAYIALYGKFMKWLEPYSEGQHDEAALQVYEVFAGTQTGQGLFEAYAAGMKQGLIEGKAEQTSTAAPDQKTDQKPKATPPQIQTADPLGALFQNLKEANGITA